VFYTKYFAKKLATISYKFFFITKFISISYKIYFKTKLAGTMNFFGSELIVFFFSTLHEVQTEGFSTC